MKTSEETHKEEVNIENPPDLRRSPTEDMERVLNGSDSDLDSDEEEKAAKDFIKHAFKKHYKAHNPYRKTFEYKPSIKTKSTTDTFMDEMMSIFVVCLFVLTHVFLPFVRFFVLDSLVINIWMQTCMHWYDAYKPLDNQSSLKQIVSNTFCDLLSIFKGLYTFLSMQHDKEIRFEPLHKWYTGMKEIAFKNISFTGLGAFLLSYFAGFQSLQIGLPIISAVSPILAKDLKAPSFEKIYSKVVDACSSFYSNAQGNGATKK